MKLKFGLLIGCIAICSLVTTSLFAQCAAIAFTSSDGNCISLVWSNSSKPSPLPSSITFAGNVYAFYTGGGELAFPAIYKKVTADDCLIPSDALSGYITINYASGSITCAHGVLLAVHDLSFTANADQHRNTLQWSLKEDENSSLYDVERSVDGELYTKIKTLTAKGNNGGKTVYNYSDNQPTPVAYYRLKVTEKNGAIMYSKVVKVQNNNIKLALAVYPNPNKGSFTLTGIDAKELASLNIIDIQGRKVGFKAISNGAKSALISVKGNVKGMYFVQYNSAAAGRINTRFMIQ